VRVLIAPDSFKGTLGAIDVAGELAGGWLAERPGDRVTRLPLADGGEGTLDVLAAAVPEARWHRDVLTGPVGAPVSSRWLGFPGGTAVVELAECSGIIRLPRDDSGKPCLAPMTAQTFGLGEALGRALDQGATRIMVTVGGSASTDGGTGALAALGARFLGAAGQPLPLGGGALAGLAAVDLTELRPPPAGGVTCLTDVTAPLLGGPGAAKTYGPQKGADDDQIARLEAGLHRLAELLGGNPSAPGAGAAGGTGYGLATAWGAALTLGAPELCRLAGLDQALATADLVITGEGRFDETSLTGKICGTVIGAAAVAGVPVALVAGQVSGAAPDVARLITLAGLAGGTAAALTGPGRWLREAGRQLAGGSPIS
jgi:glycerate kinase